MAVPVERVVVRLLSEYEEISKKRHSRIAEEMDIEISNYYLYRTGRGNPTAKTIDKMIAVIQMDHLEIIIRTGMWYLGQIDLEGQTAAYRRERFVLL